MSSLLTVQYVESIIAFKQQVLEEILIKKNKLNQQSLNNVSKLIYMIYEYAKVSNDRDNDITLNPNSIADSISSLAAPFNSNFFLKRIHETIDSGTDLNMRMKKKPKLSKEKQRELERHQEIARQQELERQRELERLQDLEKKRIAKQRVLIQYMDKFDMYTLCMY